MSSNDAQLPQSSATAQPVQPARTAPPAQPTQTAQAAQPVQAAQAAVPQYAPPQYQPPAQYAQVAPGGGQRGNAHAPGSLNVPGIAALALLLVNALIPMLTPTFYRLAASSDAFQLLGTILSIVNIALLLTAGVLAIIGLVAKRMTRWRWAAIGAAVAAGIGLVSYGFSLLGGLIYQFSSSF